jgi:hypothetical protein
MAIKVSGIIVVDDNRNVTNANSAIFSSSVQSSGFLDSSSRTLVIKDSTGTIVWGN